MINKFTLAPLNTREVNAFFLTWNRCELESIGVSRKQILMDRLQGAIKPFIGQKLSPELTQEATDALMRTARGFERQNPDIRFASIGLNVDFGSIAMDIHVEKASVAHDTMSELPKEIQNDLLNDLIIKHSQELRAARVRVGQSEAPKKQDPGDYFKLRDYRNLK